MPTSLYPETRAKVDLLFLIFLAVFDLARAIFFLFIAIYDFGDILLGILVVQAHALRLSRAEQRRSGTSEGASKC